MRWCGREEEKVIERVKTYASWRASRGAAAADVARSASARRESML
jgi:hypothetical protein